MMIRAIYFQYNVRRDSFYVRLIEQKAGAADIEKFEIFHSYEDARRFISSERRRWLIDEFTKFVKHKSILFRSSSGDYYHSRARLDAITRLENGVEMITDIETQRICSIIVACRELLHLVLPHPANPSYDESITKILELQAVANDELKDVHGLFKFRSSEKEVYM